MKNFKSLTAAFVLFGFSVMSFSSKAQKNEMELKSLKDSISYIIGYDLGQNFAKQHIEVNAEVLSQAITKAISGSVSQIKLEESNQILNNYVAELKKKHASVAKKEGLVFLEENKKKEGIITTSSGLQYEVLRAGTGMQPTAKDKVTVHYLGTLLDGTKFDSSYDRGEPLTFPLSGVIKGWTEGLQLMKEGAKYRFYIPSDLGYGDQGAGANIPGGAVLIFEVELIKVVRE
jgi:FKBP-type peptidyl-prolyl cis-trans isomerase